MVRISVLVVSGLIGILGLPPEEAQKAMARGATAVVETGAEAVWTLFQGLKLTAQQIGLIAEEPPVPGAVRVPGRTRGPAEIFEKPGGMDEANKDFDDKKPENVGPLPNPDQPGGRRGTLLDGRGIVVRPMSTDGRPTLEIQGPWRRRIEVRYGSK